MIKYLYNWIIENIVTFILHLCLSETNYVKSVCALHI